jgi:hypothetical protein
MGGTKCWSHLNDACLHALLPILIKLSSVSSLFDDKKGCYTLESSVVCFVCFGPLVAVENVHVGNPMRSIHKATLANEKAL